MRIVPDGSTRANSSEGSSFPRPGVLANSGDPRYRLFQRDAIDFLRAESFTSKDLIYCDPPYLLSTRRSKHIYDHEMTDGQHTELLDVLKVLPAMVLISGYNSRLYSHKLGQWRRFAFQTVSRGGSHRTEWVWANFPEPLYLHDYRYLGSNFRERERIGRKKKRWLGKLENMPNLERQALLGAIAEAWSGVGRPEIVQAR